jgi:hypothetical protein
MYQIDYIKQTIRILDGWLVGKGVVTFEDAIFELQSE